MSTSSTAAYADPGRCGLGWPDPASDAPADGLGWPGDAEPATSGPTNPTTNPSPHDAEETR